MKMRQLFWESVLPPLLGIALFIMIWGLVSESSKNLPGPIMTWHSAVVLFSDPFYQKTPNDQGIGWNILASLQRVGIGFGMAAAIGIPLGFMIGRFNFLDKMTSPIVSMLRPVSPLAWLPIGLLVFKAANPAAIWVIFISSIWPMIINTAMGVRQLPQDYLNVARVLNLSEWKVFTKILFPATLPYMLTGIRLSIGTAWLVIVAAEMLTGGVGIGFWVWDEWNNLNVEHIIIAIFVVGIVGLLLEQFLVMLAKKFSY
jgi:nitrate/nitrite transport system permease protein